MGNCNFELCKPKNQVQNLYALSFQMSNLNELWHDERNIIITAKKEIDANQFFQYLKENLRKFADHSTFLFITGHHHKGLNKSNEAIVGETDASLHASLGSEWECLKKKLGKKCKKNNKSLTKYEYFHI